MSQPFDLVPPRGGGSVGLWVDEVAVRLARRHEVIVYSRLDVDRPAAEEREGVRHTRFESRWDERVDGWARRLERVAQRLAGRPVDVFYPYYYFTWLFHLGYVLTVARALRREAPDAIVLHNFSHFAPIVRRWNPDATIVLSMHCDWLIELDRPTVERRLRAVDAVTGCSRYIAEGVARCFPALADHCHPLHNGSDLQLFVRGDRADARVEALRSDLELGDGPVILFTGRVCPEKGVHVLLEAMQRVATQEPAATLLVVGGISRQPPSPLSFRSPDATLRAFDELRPDYRDRLRSAAEALGSRVRLVGAVPHYDLAAYYSIADLFVHPAIWNEPFGMTLTEAMGCGCPVVSTRAGGIPEVVAEGETGLLAEPGDPVSLAEALLELLREPARREEMGARGLERVRSRFTWEHTARSLEGVIEAAKGVRRARVAGT